MLFVMGTRQRGSRLPPMGPGAAERQDRGRRPGPTNPGSCQVVGARPRLPSNVDRPLRYSDGQRRASNFAGADPKFEKNENSRREQTAAALLSGCADDTG